MYDTTNYNDVVFCQQGGEIIEEFTKSQWSLGNPPFWGWKDDGPTAHFWNQLIISSWWCLNPHWGGHIGKACLAILAHLLDGHSIATFFSHPSLSKDWMRSVDFLLDLLTRREQMDVYVFSLDVRMISYDYIHHFSKILSCVFFMLKSQYARYSFLSCALDRFVVCSG